MLPHEQSGASPNTFSGSPTEKDWGSRLDGGGSCRLHGLSARVRFTDVRERKTPAFPVSKSRVHGKFCFAERCCHGVLGETPSAEELRLCAKGGEDPRFEMLLVLVIPLNPHHGKVCGAGTPCCLLVGKQGQFVAYVSNPNNSYTKRYSGKS